MYVCIYCTTDRLGRGFDVSSVLQELLTSITRGHNPEAAPRLAPYLARFSTAVMAAKKGEKNHTCVKMVGLDAVVNAVRDPRS